MKNENGRINRSTWFYVLKDIQLRSEYIDWREDFVQGNEFTLLIVTAGSGKWVLDKTELTMRGGQSYLIAPGSTARLRSETEGMCFYHLTYELWRSEGDDPGQTAPVRSSQSSLRQGELLCRPFSQCIDYLESLYRHRHTCNELESFELAVCFQAFMLFLYRQNQNDSYTLNMRHAVELSIEHLKEHYANPWTVEQLAELANVARWHYTRIFKEITTQYPLDYLNGIRIDRAKHMLLASDDRLLDIAQFVGFNSEYYFNRRFKQTVGVSPGQYRRNHYRQENMRVFAPFLEDFLVALGITPVVQCSHSRWGKQDYLGLLHVPVIDIENEDIAVLSCHKPDCIIINIGFERWMSDDGLGRLAPTYQFPHPGEDWRLTLRKSAELLGRKDRVLDIISQYEHKASEAKRLLRQSVRTQTVACLRISALGISLYAGPDHGYTGPILYKDLGLTPHPLVLQLSRGARIASLTKEWLKLLDADHLFITFDKRHSSWEGEERSMLDWSEWQSLPAVQGGCVYEVDFLTWMNYGVISHGKKIEDVLRVLA
ncbi:helix-turn-helix domain-containing protein [Paenibacillus glucanolyticus]|uniref:AraC family transcriptional regulator n=1 Tax=Paenibacillus glucanolyticus TaxID=59843 RepID=A0A163LLZ1_9BACL|nr:helix-turn-helix domain-containing protein [Paenibacillus glucanolyticus]KZS48239.1 AraC family transcriptional regulator [Paenibacillus glucanolyticus]